MNLSRQNYWVNSSESTESEETKSDDEVVVGDNHEVYKIREVPLFQGRGRGKESKAIVSNFDAKAPRSTNPPW